MECMFKRDLNVWRIVQRFLPRDREECFDLSREEGVSNVCEMRTVEFEEFEEFMERCKVKDGVMHTLF